MPSSLADYLAKNYLTADPATERPKKKRKKTKAVDTASEGLIIADDDPPDLRASNLNTVNDDEDGPSVVNAGSAEFRRAKKSSWKTVGGGAGEQDAADAILASAAAEDAARRGEGADEEAPAIADEDEGGAADGVWSTRGSTNGRTDGSDGSCPGTTEETRRREIQE
ncbi:Pre-mRNA-splicing factor cwc26 [Aspergillus wentii]